ncbi:Imm44 family immunity protein [Leptospira santarosai]|uniref:Imm44 family immunity protein n=1 Tax=Leptospira santarosai TaxID=28183 RepID=UPI0024AF50F8|nr:Imm44 family immunity protein [Leptospira santarosai]MDI7197234.1 Imm44 family immunity protein [Leptospira santarosai]
MRFFISVEIDGSSGDNIVNQFRKTRTYVETTLNTNLSTANDGTDIKEIAIIPIIVPLEMHKERKERRLFKRKEKIADYRLYIDFDLFKTASEVQAIDLLLKNILDSIRHLAKKTKNFNADAIEKDILRIFQKKYQNL